MGERKASAREVLRRGRTLAAIAVIGPILLVGWLGFECASDQREEQRLDHALGKLVGLIKLEDRLKVEQRFDAWPVLRFDAYPSRAGPLSSN